MPNSVEIELERDELLHAVCGGAKRQLDALLMRRGDHFEHVDSWQHHIMAAVCEMVVAKHFDRYWFPTYDDPKAVVADFGKRGQVRSGKRENHPLILRAKDDPDQAYVLVTYEAFPVLHIRGWEWGREVKRDEFRRPADGDKPPAWFYPQRLLRPIPACA